MSASKFLSDSEGSDDGFQTLSRASAFSKVYHVPNRTTKKFFSKSKAYAGKKEELNHSQSVRYQQVRESILERVRQMPLHLSRHVKELALHDTHQANRALEETFAPLLIKDSDLNYIWTHEKDSIVAQFQDALKESLLHKKRPLLKQIDSLAKHTDTQKRLESNVTRAHTPSKSTPISFEDAILSAPKFIDYCAHISRCVVSAQHDNKAALSHAHLQKIFSVYMSFFCSGGASSRTINPFATSTLFRGSHTVSPSQTESLLGQMQQFFLLYIGLLTKDDALTSTVPSQICTIFKLVFPRDMQRQILMQLEQRDEFRQSKKVLDALRDLAHGISDASYRSDFQKLVIS